MSLVSLVNTSEYWAKQKGSFLQMSIRNLQRRSLAHHVQPRATEKRRLISRICLMMLIHMRTLQPGSISVKVVVVFDATMSGLPNHKEAVNSVDVVYAATSDSDSWIEREVLLLRSDGCPKVWVATSDSFHQQAAHGSGAYVWNCKTLISEIKDAKKQLQALLHDDSMYSTKGKLLEHNLDPEVRDALQALKHKLAQVERS
ncbi:hypothetical protein CY35_14G066100 [Sphagnum magellanicum]|nr:hypothetical protein CY35_14G066100 [Sphagnum magellanicum]